MSAIVFTVRDTARFNPREPRNDWGVSLRHAASITSRIDSHTAHIGRDSARVLSNATLILNIVRHDTLRVTSRSSGHLTRTDTLRDTASLQSRAASGATLTQTVRDSLRAQSLALASANIRLHEQIRLIERSAGSTAFSRTLREIAHVRGAHVLNFAGTVRDRARIVDQASTHLRFAQTVRDAALLHARAMNQIAAQTEVHDAAWLRSRSQLRLDTHARIKDTAYLDSTAQLPPSGLAYSCNVITWAMSVYDHFPYRSLTPQLACTDHDLFLRGGQTDSGQPINAWITTGVLDFGDSQNKRLTALYTAGSSEQPLDIRVNADLNGQQETYTYGQQSRMTDHYQNNRALLGKGLRGRYAQFTLAGTAPFTLLRAELDCVVGTRRI